MRVLAFSGGGAKGAFQAGVLCKLASQTRTHDYDLFAGVSVGALAATYLACAPAGRRHLMAQVHGYERIWREQIHNAGAVLRTNPAYAHPIHPIVGAALAGFAHGALFDHTPLRMLIKQVLEQEGRPIRRLRIGAFSQTQRHYREFTEADPDIEAYVLASASIPALLPPVYVKGESWVDGGIRSNVPMTYLDEFAGEISRIDLILTFDPRVNKNELGNPAGGILHQGLYYARLAYQSYNYATILPYLQYAKDNPNCEIRICFPTQSLQQNPLEFNQKQITLDMEHGKKAKFVNIHTLSGGSSR